MRRLRTTETVDRYLLHCQSRGLSASTISQYSWALARLAAYHQYLPRKAEELDIVLGDSNLSLESKKDLRKCLRAFFRWCHRRLKWPDATADLDPLPRRKRLPRVFTQLELDQLISAAENHRDLVLIILVLDTGLRINEVANLRWGDIGPDYLMVRDSKSGDRLVPLSPEMKRSLLGLGDGDHVWMGKKGPLTRSGVMLAYRRLFKRSGLTGAKLGPHTLRHTMGTNFIAAGGNVFELKEILGHSSISTTQLYVTLAGNIIKQAHALHSPARTLGLLERLG